MIVTSKLFYCATNKRWKHCWVDSTQRSRKIKVDTKITLAYIPLTANANNEKICLLGLKFSGLWENTEHKSYQTISGTQPSGCICWKSRAKLPGRAKTARCQRRQNASLGTDTSFLERSICTTLVCLQSGSLELIL